MPAESPKPSSAGHSQRGEEELTVQDSLPTPCIDFETLIQVQHFLRAALENGGKGSINGKECVWEEQHLVDLSACLSQLLNSGQQIPRSLSAVEDETSDPLFTALASLPDQPSSRCDVCPKFGCIMRNPKKPTGMLCGMPSDLAELCKIFKLRLDLIRND
jgi:hypothetical protein